MTSGIERLLQDIQQESDSNIEKLKMQAHLEGKNKYDAMIHEVENRIVKTKEKYADVLHQVQANEKSKSKKIILRRIETVQNDAVESILSMAKEALINRKSEEILDLLKEVLANHVNKYKPKIMCTDRDYATISESLGNEYQVVVDETMKAGFVLIFDDYDVDYNFDNILEYHQETLKRIALKSLFEEDKDLWTI